MRSARVDSDCARAGGPCGRQRTNETTTQRSGKTRELFFKGESSKTPEDCPISARCQLEAAASCAQASRSRLIFSTRPLCFRVRAQLPAEGKASSRGV